MEHARRKLREKGGRATTRFSLQHPPPFSGLQLAGPSGLSNNEEEVDVLESNNFFIVWHGLRLGKGAVETRSVFLWDNGRGLGG